MNQSKDDRVKIMTAVLEWFGDDWEKHLEATVVIVGSVLDRIVNEPVTVGETKAAVREAMGDSKPKPKAKAKPKKPNQSNLIRFGSVVMMDPLSGYLAAGFSIRRRRRCRPRRRTLVPNL